MHRFHLPPAACVAEQLNLPEAEARHAVQVLRLAPGDPVAVHDGAGTVLACTVSGVGRRSVTLQVRERRRHHRTGPEITLFQAVAKARYMDAIVQKATELGVSRLVPVLTERAVPRLSEAEAAHKAARWREVAIEAMKQCGTPWLPEILPPTPLNDVLARPEVFDLALVAALTPDAELPRRVLAPFRGRGGTWRVAVWVGPEGDFTRAELDAIVRAGAQPVTLGPRVLRCDTAALWCLSVLGYELGPG